MPVSCRAYQHDNEGNLTKRTFQPNLLLTTEYVWDHRNRLTAVISKNGTTVTQQINYTYDAQGRRVKLTAGSNSEFFVYGAGGNSGDELSMTFEKTGSAAPVLEHRYLHGPADQVLVDVIVPPSKAAVTRRPPRG